MCLYRRSFTQKRFYTWDAFIQRSFSTRKAFRHSKLLHKDPCRHKMATECTKHFPVLLWATRLAQISSQYYIVLRALHKVLYYFVLQTVAQSTSQYYFVLQSLRVVFPVLLCTTRLAQRNLQSYFVLQSLHKAISSTTLYYKAGQHTSQYYFKYTNEVPFIVH